MSVPAYWDKKTNKGRVVYERKKHLFDWKDVRRVIVHQSLQELGEGIDFQESVDQFAAAYLMMMVGAQHVVDRFLRHHDATDSFKDQVYRLLKVAMQEQVKILERFPRHHIEEFFEWVQETFFGDLPMPTVEIVADPAGLSLFGDSPALKTDALDETSEKRATQKKRMED